MGAAAPTSRLGRIIISRGEGFGLVGMKEFERRTHKALAKEYDCFLSCAPPCLVLAPQTDLILRTYLAHPCRAQIVLHRIWRL